MVAHAVDRETQIGSDGPVTLRGQPREYLPLALAQPLGGAGVGRAHPVEKRTALAPATRNHPASSRNRSTAGTHTPRSQTAAHA